MRNLLFILVFAGFLPLSLRFSQIGLLVWTWISVMAPHRSTYGFAFDLPYNTVIAVVTVFAILFTKEKRSWPGGAYPGLMVILAVWTAITTLSAFNVDYSSIYLDRLVKTFLDVFLVMVVIRSRVRIHAMIWVLVLCLGFYGVKGGGFIIATGGAYRVNGPEGTSIGDNNQLALGVVMVIPLMVYLWLNSRNLIVKLVLSGAAALSGLAVLGSYSRGAFLALSAELGYLWLKSRNKLMPALLAVFVGVAAMNFMPEGYRERLSTIQSADEDSSFEGRMRSWAVALQIASERLTGAGFYGPQRPEVYERYAPGFSPLAAHSIYFQVLGEHGFIGLLLFLLCMAVSWFNTSAVIKRTRGLPHWAWAHDLALMTKVASIGYAVGGAALSMAYFDVPWLLWGIMAVLAKETRKIPPTRNWFGPNALPADATAEPVQVAAHGEPPVPAPAAPGGIAYAELFPASHPLAEDRAMGRDLPPDGGREKAER